MAIVSGMIAATPRQGGAARAGLQYLLRLRRLGWDVWFLEPLETPTASAASVAYIRETLEPLGLGERWALLPAGGGEPVGLPRTQLTQLARSADLLLNIAGMLDDPDVLGSV